MAGGSGSRLWPLSETQPKPLLKLLPNGETILEETIKRIDSNKVYSPCLAGGRFVEIFPDGIVRGCEVEKLWHVSKIGAVSGNGLDIVDIVKSKQAKEFQKIAKKCTCTFECANAINTVYDPKHWISLI